MATICKRCGRETYWEQCPDFACRIRDAVTVEASHAYYGCDTGCCGTVFRAVDKHGCEVWESFDFAHWWRDEGESAEDWVRSNVPAELSRCAVEINGSLDCC